ncbi:MAG: hypothetical protein Q8R60_14455 [Mycobacteriales bacterium]|nr:hypothetical protein [Mycobacteriales bacterium]
MCALACLLVYLVCAHWYGIANADSVAAAWPAHEFATRGTFYLEQASRPDNPWFTQQGEHVVSNRMPGVILVAIPLQFVMQPLGVSPLTPAVLTAVVLTSLAVANLCLVMTRCGIPAPTALTMAAALAFGTGLWPNASAELWTHGPDAFWLSLALLAFQRNRQWWAGLALAPAIMTRPHLALPAAVIGAALAMERRSLRPLYRVGLPASLGLGTLVLWNSVMFAAPSVGGGYTYAGPRIADSSPSAWAAMFDSAMGSLVSPIRGLLVFSPFVIVAIMAAWRGLHGAPGWARGAAVGGLAYQVVQWRVNSFEGGTGYYSYRLPLELLVLALPLCALGYERLAARAGVRRVTRFLVGWSIATHAVGVFWYQPLGRVSQERDPWRTWGLVDAAISRGSAGTLLAGAVFVAVTSACALRVSRPRCDPQDPRWAYESSKPLSAAVPS